LDKIIEETAMRTVIFLISIMIVGQTAMAVEGDKKQEKYEKAKTVKVEGLKERIAIEQNELSCTQAAKNYDEFKACAEKARVAMEGLTHKQKEKWDALKK
jgi:hypothetical protein